MKIELEENECYIYLAHGIKEKGPMRSNKLSRGVTIHSMSLLISFTHHFERKRSISKFSYPIVCCHVSFPLSLKRGDPQIVTPSIDFN